MNIEIRRERREDWRETERVTREAFWNVYGPGCCEHYLLHVMRSCDALVSELDFVAVDQGEIVGNVICVRARIEGDDGKEREVLTLGPISVLPEYQGRGIGGGLIEEVKKAARRLGFGAILLCGDPAYYGRNGFVAAESLGIRTADNMYMAALQVYELHEGALKGAAGRYFEDPIYGVDENCAAKFDRFFPEKEKIVGTATQKRFEELVQMMRPAPNIIEITDFDAPELDIYARLTEGQLLNRHEPEKGIFIAESPKVIERALNAGCEPLSILAESRHVEGEGKEIIGRCSGIPVYTAEFDVLTQLTGFKLTRGMLCAMVRPKLPTVEAVCRGARRIAVLENVVNPTNVGAIFRSAAALHMDAVLLTPACSNPLYRRAIRVSMGTVFQIPWTFLEEKTEGAWPEQGMEKLRKLGFKTAAMALCDDSVSIDDPQLLAEEKLAIILGTEGDGLAAGTIADCDYTVRIPMSHGVDSLNVAAASAVAFWELGKKRYPYFPPLSAPFSIWGSRPRRSRFFSSFQ